MRKGIAVGWRAGVRGVAADAGAGFDRAIGKAGMLCEAANDTAGGGGQ